MRMAGDHTAGRVGAFGAGWGLGRGVPGEVRHIAAWCAR